MILSINEIKIRKRVRKDVGDIVSLKNSLERHGLINPLLVTKDNYLIAGFRRLSAARELGWTEIEVKLIDSVKELDLLEMEMEENLVRKDFTQEELMDGLNKKKKIINPNIFIKIWNFIKALFKI